MWTRIVRQFVGTTGLTARSKVHPVKPDLQSPPRSRVIPDTPVVQQKPPRRSRVNPSTNPPNPFTYFPPTTGSSTDPSTSTLDAATTSRTPQQALNELTKKCMEATAIIERNTWQNSQRQRKALSSMLRQIQNLACQIDVIDILTVSVDDQSAIREFNMQIMRAITTTRPSTDSAPINPMKNAFQATVHLELTILNEQLYNSLRTTLFGADVASAPLSQQQTELQDCVKRIQDLLSHMKQGTHQEQAYMPSMQSVVQTSKALLQAHSSQQVFATHYTAYNKLINSNTAAPQHAEDLERACQELRYQYNSLVSIRILWAPSNENVKIMPLLTTLQQRCNVLKLLYTNYSLQVKLLAYDIDAYQQHFKSASANIKAIKAALINSSLSNSTDLQALYEQAQKNMLNICNLYANMYDANQVLATLSTALHNNHDKNAQTNLQTAQTNLQTAQTNLQKVQTDLQKSQTNLQEALGSAIEQPLTLVTEAEQLLGILPVISNALDVIIKAQSPDCTAKQAMDTQNKLKQTLTSTQNAASTARATNIKDFQVNILTSCLQSIQPLVIKKMVSEIIAQANTMIDHSNIPAELQDLAQQVKVQVGSMQDAPHCDDLEAKLTKILEKITTLVTNFNQDPDQAANNNTTNSTDAANELRVLLNELCTIKESQPRILQQLHNRLVELKAATQTPQTQTSQQTAAEPAAAEPEPAASPLTLESLLQDEKIKQIVKILEINNPSQEVIDMQIQILIRLALELELGTDNPTIDADLLKRNLLVKNSENVLPEAARTLISNLTITVKREPTAQATPTQQAAASTQQPQPTVAPNASPSTTPAASSNVEQLAAYEIKATYAYDNSIVSCAYIFTVTNKQITHKTAEEEEQEMASNLLKAQATQQQNATQKSKAVNNTSGTSPQMSPEILQQMILR